MAEFLTIYTPTYKRPILLAHCIRSVEAQTARPAIQHLIIKDETGIGIPGMYAAIPAHLGRIRGEYVYVLQDDDRLAGPEVVAELRAFIKAQGDPAVIMVKVHKRAQVLPTYWGIRPVQGHVDLGNYVVRADWFTAYVASFGRRYEGDFDFIDRLWRDGLQFAWLDLLFAQAMAVGMGRPEAEIETPILTAPERAVGKRMR